MKKPTHLLLGLCFVLLGACSGQESSAQELAEVLPPQAFKEKLEELDSPQLLDVRRPDEFARGFIEGAENANILEEEVFMASLNSLDKDRPVLVYCQAGVRSQRASAVLREKGFKAVFDLEGGYRAWLEAVGK